MEQLETDFSRLTLMCRNHEVAEFTWNHARQCVTGKTRLVDSKYLPFLAMDVQGHFSRPALTAWFKDRGIPEFRPDAQQRLAALGYASITSLMADGFGLSLSDQYWLRPVGSHASWEEVNCFTNDFPEAFGELMLPHDQSSVPSIIDRIKSSLDLVKTSPDAALNGNLPKRWRIEPDGRRALVKAGRANCRYQEPFNEVVASRLCSRVASSDEYVSYAFENGGFAKWTCICDTMVDEFTEFVPAYHIYASSKIPQSQSAFDFLVEKCRAHGLDMRQSLEKMLVVDYLTGNFDRHWSNFGILIDTETREWKSAAPLFDTGESLWRDVDTSQPFEGRIMPKPNMIRPFSRDIDSQLGRFCRDLSWLDFDALAGYPDEACEILSANPFLANDPGRLDKIRQTLERRMRDVQKLQSSL